MNCYKSYSNEIVEINDSNNEFNQKSSLKKKFSIEIASKSSIVCKKIKTTQDTDRYYLNKNHLIYF